MSSSQSIFFTDRSRQGLFQKCPRARFWGTVYGGWGIQPAMPDLDMELGKGIHFGVANLLDGNDLEFSVNAARTTLAALLQDFYPSGLINDAYLQLAEGLLRAFYAIWYPKLKAKFQIVGKAEQEMAAWLNGEEAGIAHMSRPDAVLKDKASGEFGVWSIKTTSFSDDAELELEYRTDTQGLAEMWSAEQFFGGRSLVNHGDESRVESDEAQCSNRQTSKAPTNPKMSWSQLFIIHTGAKEKTEEGTIHLSPAYQGWYKDDGLGSVQLAHSYWWKDASGKKKGLGQAWKRFNVAEMYSGGIAQWIADLVAGKIQPEAGNPLEALFFLPPAYYRREKSIEEWRLSTFYQEDNIRFHSEMYHSKELAEVHKDRILLQIFPQYRSSCIYMRRKCAFYQLCHGTAGEAENPFEHGFKWREVNHPVEISLQEKSKGEL